MKRILSAIGSAIKRVLDKDLAGKLKRAVEAAAPYIEDVYQLVKLVASLTPTRADDEILAAAEALGVRGLWQPEEDKAEALRKLVFAAAKKAYPDVPDRLINTAIELAYGALRA
jgi:hypothetical protein